LETENQEKNQNRISYKLTIKVPAQRYDSLYRSILKNISNIQHKNSRIVDVTDKFYDLKSRINNEKILESRYLKLLDKANSIKDILKIEKNLASVRTKIEQMEGSLKHLSKHIVLSICHSMNT